MNSENQPSIKPALTGSHPPDTTRDENLTQGSFSGRSVTTMEVDSTLIHTTAGQALQKFYLDNDIYKAIYLFKLANANSEFSAADLLNIIKADYFVNTPQPKAMIYGSSAHSSSKGSTPLPTETNKQGRDDRS